MRDMQIAVFCWVWIGMCLGSHTRLNSGLVEELESTIDELLNQLNEEEEEQTELELVEEVPFELDVQDLEGNPIEGLVTVNDIIYQVTCDCSESAYDVATNLCTPSKLKISLEREGTGASIHDIASLIGYASELEWVFVEQHSFKDLDGRITGSYMGAPGGDSGEFILALHVYQGLMGTLDPLTDERVESYLAEYLNYMTHDTFYMCTDDIAIDHLELTLELEGVDLWNPRDDYKEDLLELLTLSDNLGSSHIGMLLKYPDKYGLDRDMVRSFIRAYFNILWDKEDPLSEKIFLEHLVLSHEEQAFVEIHSNEGCQLEGMAPLVTGKNTAEGIMVFINHLDAVSIRRAQLANFFVDIIGQHKLPIEEKDFYDTMEHLGLAYLEITGQYIAGTLPFYTITIE